MINIADRATITNLEFKRELQRLLSSVRSIFKNLTMYSRSIVNLICQILTQLARVRTNY
jgi:hypothetical protein